MRTFKELQDTVLQWMADGGDTGLLRTLVKDGLNRSHQNLLNDDRYDFMLWPRNETLTIAPGQKAYTLHERYAQPYFFYQPEGNLYMEEVPPRGLQESQSDWYEGTTDAPDRFMLTGLAQVQTQPTAATQLQITSIGAQNPAVCQIVIRGISNDVVTEEVLSTQAAWSILYSTHTYTLIESITKVSESWVAPITVTGVTTGQTFLTLNANEYGKQYRVFELLESPTTAQAILYRFYRAPRMLVRDGDLPDVPAEYTDILVYQTLLAMAGYTRATPAEQGLWQSHIKKLTDDLQMTYKASRTMGGRAAYVRYIPRI